MVRAIKQVASFVKRRRCWWYQGESYPTLESAMEAAYETFC
jgi:hypothetical protein